MWIQHQQSPSVLLRILEWYSTLLVWLAQEESRLYLIISRILSSKVGLKLIKDNVFNDDLHLVLWQPTVMIFSNLFSIKCITARNPQIALSILIGRNQYMHRKYQLIVNNVLIITITVKCMYEKKQFFAYILWY